MDRRIFEAMAAVEERHWWFRARRRILAERIASFHLPRDAKILEAGAGSGGNLRMLSQFGSVSAFERDDDARARALARSIGRAEGGALPDEIPFGAEKFDLIVMFDVLEHLEQSTESLSALAKRLLPGGRILLTVPARPALWSRHDLLHHHFRRYTRSKLRKTIVEAGLRVQEMSYFNTVLFPLVAAGRTWERVIRSGKSIGLDVPPEPLNRLLEAAFASERLMLRHVSLPIGVSLLAVATVE